MCLLHYINKVRYATSISWRWLKAKLQNFPLLGGLVNCSFKDHCKAMKEFAITAIFATTGFWASVVILRSLKGNSELDIWVLFLQTIENGELFIFSISFLGPILMIALADRNGKREFPGRDWHVLALIGLGFLSALLFSAVKIRKSNLNLPEFLEMDFIINASMWLSAAALFLRYLTIVYHKSIVSADMAAQDVEFAKSWEAHRSAK